ncbi:MAG: Gfo/Idh/MocA family oxidoreductase [Alphaproteobacteria bacterium]|nr:Gfo/Idh/MocA family oxidoreductase [Alphaproteobacteria bacterium]
MIRTPVRIGFIGTGRISDLHAAGYLGTAAARITALCDTNVERARSRARAWGLDDAMVTDDPAVLLSRNDVDLVEILLPHHLHCAAALAAIEAGKIVSLQKPMCLTMEEANRLVDAAEAHDRPVRVFENILFDQPVMVADTLVGDGAIGRPLAIRMKSNPGKGQGAWEVPSEPTAWRQRRDLSGGGPLIFDDGHHKFSLAWHFMGEPEEVHAFIGRTTHRDGSLLDAPSIVSLRFDEQRIGSFEAIYSPDLEIETRQYPQDDRIEITGSSGIIWINRGHGSIGNQPSVLCFRNGELDSTHEACSRWEDSFVRATRHFLTCLQEGHAPVLTARNARSVLRFALAAEESARIGRAVRYTDT